MGRSTPTGRDLPNDLEALFVVAEPEGEDLVLEFVDAVEHVVDRAVPRHPRRARSDRVRGSDLERAVCLASGRRRLE